MFMTFVINNNSPSNFLYWFMQIDATEAQFTNPLREYILYADAIKVGSSTSFMQN